MSRSGMRVVVGSLASVHIMRIEVLRALWIRVRVGSIALSVTLMKTSLDL